MPQGTSPTILLIEADANYRRLIALGLQQRKGSVIELSSPSALVGYNLQNIDVLIWDVDGVPGSNWKQYEQYQAHLVGIPTILLAWEHPCSSIENSNTVIAAPPQVKYLTKPLDVRLLHQTILQFLREQVEQKDIQEARIESDLLTESPPVTPTIWPMITAAGLFITVVGVLLHIAVVLLGMTILVISLFWWLLAIDTHIETVSKI